MEVIARCARASEWGEPGLKRSDCVSGQRTGVLVSVCTFAGCLSIFGITMGKKPKLQIDAIVK